MKDNKIRLQKHLSECGIASRRKAEELISQGKVKVNGRIAQIGDKVDPKRDKIMVRGKNVVAVKEKIYIMLHKPRGFVTTLSDERGRATVRELVASLGHRVYPVGRLDMDSEGLLLMTNDGSFANKAAHPRYEREKSYLVSVKGDADAAYVRLTEPIVIDGKETKEAQVRIVSSDGEKAKLIFTLKEGRNRQVRRLCEAAGLTVTRLIRISEAGITVEGLKPGKWRHLTKQEIRGFTGRSRANS